MAHGTSDRCPGCRALSSGGRAQCHTEECRIRVEGEIRKTEGADRSEKSCVRAEDAQKSCVRNSSCDGVWKMVELKSLPAIREIALVKMQTRSRLSEF